MITKIALSSAALLLAAFSMNGCSAAQEMMASQMEVPTLEIQANRVALGMTIVRGNNIMAFKMPLSGDAKWPAKVASDLNETEQKFIADAIMDEPYYATAHYTKHIQRKMLGSGALMSQLGDYGNIAAQLMDQTISPLAYRAVQKITVFYGKDKANWPNVFNFDDSLGNFLEFKDGKMIEIEAATGDVYPTIGNAVIALAPVNLQKDLATANDEMLEAFQEVGALEGEKGEIKTRIDGGKKEGDQTIELSAQEKLDAENELATIEQRLKEAQSIADEKEKIYFELLDQMSAAVQADINLDGNYVALAKNVNIVSKEILVGGNEAYTAFGLATAQIVANNILAKFPKELESLAVAKAHVPANLQAKFDERMVRLAKNAIYLLPNVGIGTYYAYKQKSLAEKYENVTDIIMLAHQTKVEQEAAAQEALEKAQAAEKK